MNKDDPVESSLLDYYCTALGKPLAAGDIGTLTELAKAEVRQRGRPSQSPYYIKLYRRGQDRPVTQIVLPFRKGERGMDEVVFSSQR